MVISGGAGALGRCICTRLANCGATVVSIDVADDDADQGGGKLEPVWRLRADISESGEVDMALEAVRERFGRFPTTVCCHAGVVASYPILDYPIDAFDQLFRANVRGAFVLAQAASRRWREADVPGHIIFTSSWVQDYPWPGIGPYCASKAAVFGLCVALRRNWLLTASGLTPFCQGSCPQAWRAASGTKSAYRRRAQDAIALGELQDPNSVADTFAFLCSPMASYMTGSPLLVDGGCALRGP